VVASLPKAVVKAVTAAWRAEVSVAKLDCTNKVAACKAGMIVSVNPLTLVGSVKIGPTTLALVIFNPRCLRKRYLKDTS
jgi:hypothetical protein